MANGRREIATKTQSAPPAAAGDPPASFEQALQRLGGIVEQLEDGEQPLEQALELFEEGVKLVRAAQLRLDAAEKRVEELMALDELGNPVVRELGVE